MAMQVCKYDHPFVSHKQEFLAGHLAEPLQSLPPVEFACAYGSGVFSQYGLAGSDVPMIDYILGVSSPIEWHAQNLEANPNHYSALLRYGGAKWVCWLAEMVGVGIHFNPYVSWGRKTIKYGVISTNNLVKDILSWETLYMSGRLQKPVCVIRDRLELAKLNEVNLQATLYAALLLLPPHFSEVIVPMILYESSNDLREVVDGEDLLTTICGISYTGDVRMYFAEDKNKVRNIVRGNAQSLHELYKNSIYRTAALGILSTPSSDTVDLQCKFYQDDEKGSRCLLLSSLPCSLLRLLGSRVGVKYAGEQSSFAIAEALVQTGGCDVLLRRSLGGMVRASSSKQMVSGLFAAGGLNAVKYVGRKAFKAWLSRK